VLLAWGKQTSIESVSDEKEFKKLLRTRKNVLVAVGKDGMRATVSHSNQPPAAKALSSLSKTLQAVATSVDGTALVVSVDCRCASLCLAAAPLCP
jgi:hypothetical protein